MVENKKYYELVKDLENNNNTKKQIKSDFVLLLLLLKDFFTYILLFIPNLLTMITFMFKGNNYKMKIYFKKTFIEPFSIIFRIFNWFFEGRVTSFLILILIVVFIIQITYINFNVELLNSLMTYQSHFETGNFTSVLTSIFLHGSLSHLIGNLIALLVFGRIVERELGFKTIFIFLFSGVLSNIVSNYVSYAQGDIYYSLGASGAIAGLNMYAIILSPFAITSILIFPLPIFVFGWFLIFLDFLLLNTNSQTNRLAHVAGYCAILITFIFLKLKERKKILTGLMINLIMLLVFYLLYNIFNFNILNGLIFG